MRSKRAIALASACAAVVIAQLSGCASSGPSATTPRAARPPAGTAPADAVAARAEPAGADELSAIDAILAERRRSDLPEIEIQETGFTITEQVRIGNDARSDYERAMSLLRQERYAEGISLLQSVIEQTPDATAPYIDLAMAYRLTGELEQAEQELRTAELLSPDNPIVLNELGIVHRRAGRFAEARSSYERALAVFQGFHFARRNLAVLCDLYLADLQCALDNYRLYLESVGSDPEVEIWVADIENRLGN